MSFFARQHGHLVSNAETELLKILHSRRIFPHCQYTFPLTSADFYLPERRIAVFLDGPHHLKQRQEIKDDLIDQVLGSRGVTVLRFSYKPPITKKRLREIADRIEAAVRGLRICRVL